MSDRHTMFVEELNQSKCDPKLGAEVKSHLQKLGLIQVQDDRALSPSYHPELAVQALKTGIHNAFMNLGLDIDNDPSMRDTPRRYAHMLVGELTKGLNFDFFPKCTATPNGETTSHRPLYQEKTEEITVGAYNQMVLVDNIETMSLCEHHLQTIDGFTHIAYIPGPKVLGLSKFARVTEFFARRPQIQERMTEQIYAALAFILETEDIAVVQRATHFCMRARGARQHSTQTTTDKMGGRFMSNPALRTEFLDAIPR